MQFASESALNQPELAMTWAAAISPYRLIVFADRGALHGLREMRRDHQPTFADVRWISPNDANGATDDSADNARGDSTSSDSAVRSNRGIRSSSQDNSQGNNSLVNPRRPRNGHLLLQAAE
jgi:hypothetical protein